MALTFSGTQKVELASFTFPSPTYSVVWWANGAAPATDMLYWINLNCGQSYWVGGTWHIDINNADLSGDYVCSPAALSGWNHFAVTNDTTTPGTLPVMYINGATQSVSLNAGGGAQFTPAANTLTWGNDPAGGGSTGEPLAWFAIHNVILTPTEVTTLQTTGFVSRGCQVAWEGATATNQTDLSGNGRTGILTGTPTVTDGPISSPPASSTTMSRTVQPAIRWS